MTYFRSDGWVKSATGQAIAGAQIYVCTQPANTTFVPPLPLQQVYADPQGIVPIIQPVVTNGFGHYDFYVAYGFYTIVVVNGGAVQQAYPDQTIGFVGSGGIGTVTNNSGALIAGQLVFGNGGSDIATGTNFSGIATQYLDGTGNFSTPSSGTVTNTLGALIAGQLIFGNGGSDVKTGTSFSGIATQYLDGTGNFSVPAGSGGGTPGLPLGSLQGNNAGAFAGLPGSTCDFTNGLLALAPTGAGVALSVTGDGSSNDIADFIAHSGTNQEGNNIGVRITKNGGVVIDPTGTVSPQTASLTVYVDAPASNTVECYCLGSFSTPSVYIGKTGSLYLQPQSAVSPLVAYAYGNSSTPVFTMDIYGGVKIYPITVALNPSLSVIGADSGNTDILSTFVHTDLSNAAFKVDSVGVSTFARGVVLNSTLTDSSSSVGTSGQVLSSTGTAVQWITSGTAVGANVAPIPWNQATWSINSSYALPTAGYTYCEAVFANAIQVSASTSKISFNVKTALSAVVQEICIVKTLKDSLTTVAAVVVTFGGTSTPLFNTTGVKTSDPITLTIDAQHDYYICFHGNAYGGSGQLAAQASASIAGGVYPALFFGGNLNGDYNCSTYWSSSVGAGNGFSSYNGTPNASGTGSTGLFLTGWVTA